MKKLLLATALAAVAAPAAAEVRVVLQTWNPAARPADGVTTVFSRPERVHDLLRAG